MSIVYNALLWAASAGVKALAPRRDDPRNPADGAAPVPSKLRLFARGQKEVGRELERAAAADAADRRPTVWIHSASLGEYAIARPLIAELRKRGDYRVVMTFFSPSGYEALKDSHQGIDRLFYLPLDTRSNVKRYLDLMKPSLAIFTVSEYWYNYLTELRRRNTPVFLVSAKITARSAVNRWYGFLHRRCLRSFRHFFVIDDDSQTTLARLGYTNVTVSGNPLFDNAVAKAATPWRNAVVEAFAAGGNGRVFIAGSLHDSRDTELVCALARNHHDARFVMVPHDVNPAMMEEIERLCDRPAIRLSMATEADAAAAEVLIVDTVGELAYLYRYGKWAYVGGGFTPYLHSLIEATVYGLPVTYGPFTHRKVTPEQLESLGIGARVSTPEELDRWFAAIKDDPGRLDSIREKATRYVSANANATAAIVNKIVG